MEDEAEGVAAQFGAAGIAHGIQIRATEGHCASGRLDDAGERVQQRGLAGARRAHDSNRLTLTQCEAHVVQGKCVHGWHGETGLTIGSGNRSTCSGRNHTGNAMTGLRTGHTGGVVHDQVMCLDHRRPLLPCVLLLHCFRCGLSLLKLLCCCIHTPESTDRAEA